MTHAALARRAVLIAVVDSRDPGRWRTLLEDVGVDLASALAR